MFTVGDLVVYGGEGVCRVDGVGPSRMPGADKEKIYYTLAPLDRNGQVLTPVDTKVLIRPIMNKEQAQELVANLSTLEADHFPTSNARIMKEHYHEVVMSYDCEQMARLIKAIYRKRHLAIQHGKKVSQLDERYLKRAEDQFYGELSVALGMERKTLETYVLSVDPRWPE